MPGCTQHVPQRAGAWRGPPTAARKWWWARPIKGGEEICVEATRTVKGYEYAPALRPDEVQRVREFLDSGNHGHLPIFAEILRILDGGA